MHNASSETNVLSDTGRVSAVEFDTETRIHIGIYVSSVERSLPFYERLFNQTAAKVRPGYAKFEVANPPVNYVLNERKQIEAGGGLSHLGIQVKSTLAVGSELERLSNAGLETLIEEQVACCYAVQDKFWVRDPDGNRWEIFVVTDPDTATHGKSDAFAASDSTQAAEASELCCTEPSACCG